MPAKKTPKGERDKSIKPVRGYICGLISYDFLCRMLDAPRGSVEYRLRKYLVKIGQNTQTMSPRQLCEFIEGIHIERLRNGGDFNSIKDFVWMK